MFLGSFFHKKTTKKTNTTKNLVKKHQSNEREKHKIEGDLLSVLKRISRVMNRKKKRNFHFCIENYKQTFKSVQNV